MKKITDRYLLGIISGIGGNIAKSAFEGYLKRNGIIEVTSKEKAAGIFLKKSDLQTPYGKMVGKIADYMIGAGLGISCVYWLTFMGKDNYLLKGIGLGAMEWTALYGVVASMGATSIFPVKSKDAYISLLSHVVFGGTKIFLAKKLGDDKLFHPQNLLSSDNLEQEQEYKTPPETPGDGP